MQKLEYFLQIILDERLTTFPVTCFDYDLIVRYRLERLLVKGYHAAVLSIDGM